MDTPCQTTDIVVGFWRFIMNIINKNKAKPRINRSGKFIKFLNLVNKLILFLKSIEWILKLPFIFILVLIMEKLKYLNKPIYSIKSLTLLLGINKAQLLQIAKNSNKYFQLVKQIKKDGSERDCHNIREPLKSIHKKIKGKIISNVYYPLYIQGSIKGRSNLTNAKLHERSAVIVQLDIKNFFPSIKTKYIYDLWKYFFNFSDEVSNLLTNLITFKGSFIQGSTLSSDIANLIFWDKEHYLVEKFKDNGLVYSRYIDDINISSKNKISDILKTDVIQQVHSMAKSKELKLKNNKTKILNKNNQLLVTGLVVNDKAKVNKQYIDDVYQEAISGDYNYNSINGKLNYIKQTNPKKASNILKIVSVNKANSTNNVEGGEKVGLSC